MLDPELLAMLRCPQTSQCLREAGAEQIAEVNRTIAAGTLRDVGDRRVEEPLNGGLVNKSGEYLYPIRDEIPTLIPDWAIRLDAVVQPANEAPANEG